MDEKQGKKRILFDLIRREVLKGTSPRKTYEMVRAMILQDPSLLDISDLEQLVQSDRGTRQRRPIH